jgi:hypothetical protein
MDAPDGSKVDAGTESNQTSNLSPILLAKRTSSGVAAMSVLPEAGIRGWIQRS